jgi:orotidine-5'-phosphate decarboxylase
MERSKLIALIRQRGSFLCIGLDSDKTRIPQTLLHEDDPVFSFNKAIIDATRNLCVAYKINTAFYEADGVRGWQSMERTVNYIGEEHLKIADAKRGDIGNTSRQYAKAFFHAMPFDAITVAPYMGEDSIRPFLETEGKWAIVLGLTSNKGAEDFELQKCGEEFLFEKVLRNVSKWGSIDNLMFVTGATRPDEMIKIRRIVPRHFLLVPGVGAQGGDLEKVASNAMNTDVGLLVNVSRDIIFADSGPSFAEAAGQVAAGYCDKMRSILSSPGLQEGNRDQHNN